MGPEWGTPHLLLRLVVSFDPCVVATLEPQRSGIINRDHKVGFCAILLVGFYTLVHSTKTRTKEPRP